MKKITAEPAYKSASFMLSSYSLNELYQYDLRPDRWVVMAGSDAMEGTQGQQRISFDEMARKGLRASAILAVPGFILSVAGFGLTVAAYAGRAQGNFAMALGGVASLLVGLGLLFSALVVLVVSLVNRARARRQALLRDMVGAARH